MPILHQLHHLDMVFSTFVEFTILKVHNRLQMRRVIFVFLVLLMTACTAPQAVTPSPTPSATLTRVPTNTAVPSVTPTPTPQFPSYLVPEDQQWLKDNADNPQVSWQVNPDGVTEVTINQPLNLSQDELKAKINAECLGNCLLIDNEMGDFLLLGVFTGEIDVVFSPDGSTVVVTSMYFLYQEEIKTITMRWFLDPRDLTNAWLYSIIGIQGDRATLDEIVRVFAAGHPAHPVFLFRRPDEQLRNTPFFIRYFEEYDNSDYYSAVREYWESGFNQDYAFILLVAGSGDTSGNTSGE